MEESTPEDIELSRTETITALVHYYRAEVSRSLAWRDRLDRTTNWAVGTSAALVGVGFSHPEVHHAIFLFAFAVVYTMLYVEARRYRFYDAYEYRVRLLHQNFIYGVLTGRLSLAGSYWVAELASDLLHPQYKMDFSYALARRIKATYAYLFTILTTAWLMKIRLHPTEATTWHKYVEQAAVGALPGWCVLILILLFVLHLLLMVRIGRESRGGRDIFHPHSPPPKDASTPG